MKTSIHTYLIVDAHRAGLYTINVRVGVVIGSENEQLKKSSLFGIFVR